MSTVIQPQPKFELAPYQSLENEALVARIKNIKQQMGSELLILGHHYQQDEVIEFADLRGDSLQVEPIGGGE